MGKEKPANKISKGRDPKKPANKISKFKGDPLSKLERNIDRIQKKIIKGEVKQGNLIDKARDSTEKWRKLRKRDLHQLKKGLHKNRLQLSSKFKRSRPTIRFEQSPLGSFERKIGVGKHIYGTGVEPFDPTKPDIAEKVKSRILKDKLVKMGDELTKKRIDIAKKTNQLRNLNRSNYFYDTLAAGANEFPGQKLMKPSEIKTAGGGRFINTDNVVKATRLGIGALKTVKGVGMGLALNYLSDRFLAPHVRTAGWKLGQALVPVGRKIDQLRIRNMKDGE